MTRLAGVLLIAATWLSAPLAQTPAPAAEAEKSPPRFRADAWSLPDEELLGFVEVASGLLAECERRR